jgi:hypothetical protein
LDFELPFLDQEGRCAVLPFSAQHISRRQRSSDARSTIELQKFVWYPRKDWDVEHLLRGQHFYLISLCFRIRTIIEESLSLAIQNRLSELQGIGWA